MTLQNDIDTRTYWCCASMALGAVAPRRGARSVAAGFNPPLSNRETHSEGRLWRSPPTAEGGRKVKTAGIRRRAVCQQLAEWGSFSFHNGLKPVAYQPFTPLECACRKKCMALRDTALHSMTVHDTTSGRERA
jgi:hypothetical protein